mgnify:CR=1 FL=1
MRKHFTRVLTALLVAVMLLPIVVQATPADGWTDEAEQAYQTVTELVVQRVTESKDYLAAATQEENAKAVYALWTSGAAVPGGTKAGHGEDAETGEVQGAENQAREADL